MSQPNNNTYPIPLSRFYNLQNNYDSSPRIDPQLNPSSVFLGRVRSAANNQELILHMFHTAGCTVDLTNQQDRETLIAAVSHIKSTQNSECLRLLAQGLFEDKPEQTKKKNADSLFDLCCAEGISSYLPDLALDLVECTSWYGDMVVVNALLRACEEHGHYYYMAKIYMDFCTRRDYETYRVVVQGLCKAGDLESAVYVMKRMRREGLTPDLTMKKIVMGAFIINKVGNLGESA